MARNAGKGGRNNNTVGENSRNAVPYLVRDADDDDDGEGPLPVAIGESSLQIRPSNVVATGGHMAETTVPNFLLKLWKLVEDKNYDFCICWDESGSSFHVKEPYNFSRDVLPLFFKHSNLNSFVRQLNMYGFRKVTNLEQGALKHQANDVDSLEFHHQYFIRDHPELLQYIRRKSATAKASGDLVIAQNDTSGTRRLNTALEEIRQLREKQIGMDAKLNQMKRENESLWREMAHMRQLHLKQQQVVNKLIQFLLTVVQPATGGRLGKRALLAIGSGFLNQQPGQSPMKRARMDSGDAAEMIESLEQELRNRPRPEQPRMRKSYSLSSNFSGGGPMIADITEELEPEANAGTLNSNADGNIGIVDYGKSPIAQSDISGSMGASPQGQQTVVEQPEPDPLAFLVPTVPNNAIIQQQSAINQQQMVSQPWIASNLAAPSQSTGATGQTIYYDPVLLSPSGRLLSNDELEWSKPGGQFSQHLDYVQSDLDSLKDFLSSEGLDLDGTSLDDLFVAPDEVLVPDTSAATAHDSRISGNILGNEVQLYKTPESLINFDFDTIGNASESAPNNATIASPTETVPVSGDVLTTPSDNSSIFVSPSAIADESSIFDQLDTPLFSADPMINTPPQENFMAPALSPNFDQLNPSLQQTRGETQARTSNREATDLRLQNQGNLSGGGTVDDVLRSALAKSNTGKKR